MTWVLEPMRHDDLPAVLSIERESYPNPWTDRSFEEELRNPCARLIVAREDPQCSESPALGGYVCVWVLHDELLINNLSVGSRLRRRRLGTLLLDEAISIGRAAGCRTAWLEVRPSNEPALRLYRSRGFEEAHRRKQYYSDSMEDALVMRAALMGSENE